MPRKPDAADADAGTAIVAEVVEARERRRRSFGRSPDDAPPRKIVGYSKSTAEETWGA
jgi:hypothetical protein